MKEQLQALDQNLSQILTTAKLAPELDFDYYKDRVAQSRTCINAALEECKEPGFTIFMGRLVKAGRQADSDEFIADVIEEQRIVIEKLCIEVGLVSEEPIPDTERAPDSEAPDTLESPTWSETRLKKA